MPSIDERIATALKRKESHQEKIAALKSLNRLQNGITEADSMIERLQAEKAKKEADERRKEDNAARILLGAGILLLPKARMLRAIKIVLAVLKDRDQERILTWAQRRDIDLEDTASATSTEEFAANEPGKSTTSADVEAKALVGVMAQFDASVLSSMQTEFLSIAKGDDRRLLEGLFVKLGKRLQSGTASEETNDQAVPKTAKPKFARY